MSSKRKGNPFRRKMLLVLSHLFSHVIQVTPSPSLRSDKSKTVKQMPAKEQYCSPLYILVVSPEWAISSAPSHSYPPPSPPLSLLFASFLSRQRESHAIFTMENHGIGSNFVSTAPSHQSGIFSLSTGQNQSATGATPSQFPAVFWVRDRWREENESPVLLLCRGWRRSWFQASCSLAQRRSFFQLLIFCRAVIRTHIFGYKFEHRHVRRRPFDARGFHTCRTHARRISPDTFVSEFLFESFSLPTEPTFYLSCWNLRFFFFFLNLGPGCSSLGVGAFSENGPFRPSGKVLVRNEYSWNRGSVFFHYIIDIFHFVGNFKKIKDLIWKWFCGLLILQKQICCIWRHQLELGSLTQMILHLLCLWMTRSQACLSNFIHIVLHDFLEIYLSLKWFSLLDFSSMHRGWNSVL